MMKKNIPLNPTSDGTARTIKAQYYKNSMANFVHVGAYGATAVAVYDDDGEQEGKDAPPTTDGSNTIIIYDDYNSSIPRNQDVIVTITTQFGDSALRHGYKLIEIDEDNDVNMLQRDGRGIRSVKEQRRKRENSETNPQPLCELSYSDHDRGDGISSSTNSGDI